MIRLSSTEQQVIKQTILQYDPQAKIYLFGSRVDRHKKGGDIDLLIISDNLKPKTINKIRWQLWEILGVQKIDLVLADQQLSTAFARTAYEQGVLIE
jgi:predicted nucleotidyltransferase